MIGTVQAPPPDSLRSILRDVFAGPEYAWEEEPNTVSLLRDLWQSFIEWADSLQASHPVAYWSVLGLVTAIAVLLMAHMGVLVWRALHPSTGPVAPSAPARLRVKDAAWHLAEMRRLRADGHYLEALAHRFTALLLELDRRDAVRFHPSKTPAEYAREARVGGDGGATLGTLVSALYDHLFAGVPCTDEDVERFDRRASELGEIVAAH